MAPEAPSTRHASLRGRHVGVALFAVVSAALGYALATSYAPNRLASHEGFALVRVDDAIAVRPLARPRHVVLVVIDGLRRDAAQHMRAMQRLGRAGVCLPTHVGLPSVSRPVYATLSTGLEQDRTGARSNDAREPLAAASVWESARRAGLTTSARSSLSWWQELFPRGFDRFVDVPMERNPFAAPITSDLTLIHPEYVDDASHDHGARSAETRAAVTRVDRELVAMLGSLDLARDAVVVTADHGHVDRGGHGGPSPEVETVLTCMAGRGLRRANAGASRLPPSLDARVVAPLLALLVGAPFPATMRAGEDSLDSLFALAAPQDLGAAYLADRAHAIARFRSENQHALRRMSDGAATTWSAWRSQATNRRLLLGIPWLLAWLGIVAWTLARGHRGGHVVPAVRDVAFAVAFVLAPILAYRAIAGPLDVSSLNTRGDFIAHVLAASLVSLAPLVLLHVHGWRDARSLCRALLLATTTLLVANAAHVAVFGWPLAAPLPGPFLYFAPFLLSTLLVTVSAVLAIAATTLLVRALVHAKP